jgi:hypothetical protein
MKKSLQVASLLLLAAFVSATAFGLPRLPDQKDKKTKISTGTAQPTPDKGKFRVMLDGQLVGNEEFEITPTGDSWTARGSTTMSVPGSGEIKATGRLRLAADFTPIRYEWSSQTQKKASGAVDFAKGTAKTAIDLGGATPFTQDFTFPSARIAVLDNNLYHQYAVLAQMYDWNAAGKQEFAVLIPQDLTPGSISVESLGPQQVDAAKYEALRVSSTDLEIIVYLDSSHHLMRLEVPASKVTIQRE